MWKDHPGIAAGIVDLEKIVEFATASLGVDVDRYCRAESPDFVHEIRTLFMLATLWSRGHWIADDPGTSICDSTAELFAYCSCCHAIEWREEIGELRMRANQFIRRMREELPFWRRVPLFRDVKASHAPSEDIPVAAEIRKWPLLSRVHLLSFMQDRRTSLVRATTWDMRAFGLNGAQSAPILLASGICVLRSDAKAFAGVLSKNQLAALLDEGRVPYAKAWRKERVFSKRSTRTLRIFCGAWLNRKK